MKKVLICILLMGITAVTTTAQQQLPLDPKIKVGKLDNGLTYILRHNEKPAGQADFYIAQRVGSILENDDQQGPVFADAGGLEPQVTVPSEGHEDVGEDEQNEGI